MKDAESEPSPSRFWRRLGLRRAAAKASAAGPRASTDRRRDSRSSPDSRDRAIPATTAEEPRPPCRFDVSSRSGAIDATVLAVRTRRPTLRERWVA